MAKKRDREATILFAGDRLSTMEQFAQLAREDPSLIAISCSYTLPEGLSIPAEYRVQLQERGLELEGGRTEGQQSVTVDYSPQHTELLAFLSAHAAHTPRQESFEMDGARGICSVTLRSTDLQKMLGEADAGEVYQLKRSLSSSDVRVNEIVGKKFLYDPKYAQPAAAFIDRIQKGDFPEPQNDSVDLKTLGMDLDGCATKMYILLAAGVASLLLYAGYQLARKGSEAVNANNNRLEQYMGDEPPPPPAHAPPQPTPHVDALKKKDEKKPQKPDAPDTHGKKGAER